MDVFSEVEQFLGSEGFQNFIALFQNVYSHLAALTVTEFMQFNGPIQIMINEERHARSKDGTPIMSFTAFHGW